MNKNMNRYRKTYTRAGTELRVLAVASLMTVSLWTSVGTAQAQALLGPATSDSAVTLKDNGGAFTLNLTKIGDKTAPVARFGYQSLGISNQVRGKKVLDKNNQLRNIWTFGVELKAIPAGDVANVLSGTSPSSGGDIQISIGKSYLNSFVRPENNSFAVTGVELLEQSVKNILQDKRAALDAKAAGTTADERKKAADKALKVAKTEDEKKQALADRTSAIDEQKKSVLAGTKAEQNILDSIHNVTALIQSLQERLCKSKNGALNEQLQTAITYANDVLTYCNEVNAITSQDKLRGFSDPAPTKPTIVRPVGRVLYDNAYLRLGASQDSRDLFDASPGIALDKRVTTKDFTGYSIQTGYSANYGGKRPMIFGAAIGYANTSNFSALQATEITENSSFSSSDGISKISTSNKRTVYTGAFKNQHVFTYKYDLILYPDLTNNEDTKSGKPRNALAIDFFGRGKAGSPLVVGVGAYITKPGAPSTVYGGLNVYRAENRHVSVDIVAGFPF